MRKLRTQFGALRGKRFAVAGAGCSCTCCCCSCFATTAVFSLATSRYLYVKAKAYNGKEGADPVSALGFGAYGLLSYVLLVIFVGGAAGAMGVAGIVAVLMVHLLIAVLLFQQIELRYYTPVLLLVGFGAAFGVEFLVWAHLAGLF